MNGLGPRSPQASSASCFPTSGEGPLPIKMEWPTSVYQTQYIEIINGVNPALPQKDLQPSQTIHQIEALGLYSEIEDSLKKLYKTPPPSEAHIIER